MRDKGPNAVRSTFVSCQIQFALISWCETNVPFSRTLIRESRFFLIVFFIGKYQQQKGPEKMCWSDDFMADSCRPLTHTTGYYDFMNVRHQSRDIHRLVFLFIFLSEECFWKESSVTPWGSSLSERGSVGVQVRGVGRDTVTAVCCRAEVCLIPDHSPKPPDPGDCSPPVNGRTDPALCVGQGWRR